MAITLNECLVARPGSGPIPKSKKLPGCGQLFTYCNATMTTIWHLPYSAWANLKLT